MRHPPHYRVERRGGQPAGTRSDPNRQEQETTMHDRTGRHGQITRYMARMAGAALAVLGAMVGIYGH